jgi:signal transduction histidine kinase
MEREELMEYLRLVDEQIDRCVLITQRLLRLSQPSVEPLSPCRCARRWKTCWPCWPRKPAAPISRARWRWNPTSPVLMDEGELRQVLLNLAHNAMRAMPREAN